MYKFNYKKVQSQPKPNPISKVYSQTTSETPVLSVNTGKNKTIVHVLDYNNGIGDYLRGSMYLAQLAKQMHVFFKMDISHHAIYKYTDTNIPVSTISDKIQCFLVSIHSEHHLFTVLNNFINSNDTMIYITTNFFIHKVCRRTLKTPSTRCLPLNKNTMTW